MTHDAELDGIIEFLRIAERLKSHPRSGRTSTGEPESVAAHSWRLCLIHDLGEALRGDTPAPAQTPEAGKAAREREDLQVVMAALPARLKNEFTALWDEYEAARTPEARFAKGLDKLETILQHTQGLNPPDFDYEFNLDYGRAYTTADPLLAALRARLDRETAARARGEGPGGG